jgi:excisionase family DNA binding protein
VRAQGCASDWVSLRPLREEPAKSPVTSTVGPMRRLLPYAAAATYLGVSVRAMNNLAADGRIPKVTVGARVLFDKDDLAAFVDQIRSRLRWSPASTSTQSREGHRGVLCGVLGEGTGLQRRNAAHRRQCAAVASRPRPALGAYPIASVRQTMVQGFIKKVQTKKLAAGTIRNIYDVLAQVFSAAVDDRVIAVSPCRKITLPKDHDDEVEDRWRVS